MSSSDLDALRQRGVALHVGEPDDGVDAFGSAARHLALQHSPPGITAEIGLDQRLGDAGERHRLDGKAEHRHQPPQRLDIGIGEAARPRRRPARHEAVHLADGRLLVETLHHGEPVGLAFLPQLFQDRKVGRLAEMEAPAHLVLAALQQMVEGAAKPAASLLTAGGRLVLRRPASPAACRRSSRRRGPHRPDAACR